MNRKDKKKITPPKLGLGLSVSRRTSKGRPPDSVRYVTPDEVFALITKLAVFAYDCELMHEYAFGPDSKQILWDFLEDWSEASNLVLEIERLLAKYDEKRLDIIKRNFLIDALPVYTRIVEDTFNGVLTEPDSKIKMETEIGPYLKKAGFTDIRVPLGLLHVGIKDRKKALEGPRRFAGSRLGSLINISYAQMWGLYKKRSRRVFLGPIGEATRTSIESFRGELLYAFLTKTLGFDEGKANVALKSVGLRTKTSQKMVKNFPENGSFARYDHIFLLKFRPMRRKHGDNYEKLWDL